MARQDSETRLETAFERFDSYNKNDPNQFTWEGIGYPQEFFLATRLHEWVLKLDPEPSEALLLASRCQHLGRWEILRRQYADTREGYLKWRKELSYYHAEKAESILRSVGYPPVIIEEVMQILLKKRLKLDPAVQTMENALCLVFLEFQYEEFLLKHGEKIVNILHRSLLKMDSNGHKFALSLSYSDEGQRYIAQALSLIVAK